MATRDDLKAAAVAVGDLAGLFGRDLEPGSLVLYARACLSKLSLAQLRQAIGEAATKCSRWPAPADLIAIVRGTPQERAEKALQAVHEAVREVGGYRTPHFADPAISHALEALGGWVAFCDAPTSTMKDHQFRQAYVAFAERATEPATLRSLHGGKERRVEGSLERIEANVPIRSDAAGIESRCFDANGAEAT